VANSRKANVPNAPELVGYWSQRKLKRMGRSDARKYTNFQDTTATHAINKLEAQMKAGQSKVNQWMAIEMSSLWAGNHSIRAQIAQIDERIALISANLGPTGRIRKANTVRLAQLRQQRFNALTQRASNHASARALREIAEEANQTWHRFYGAQAAIYVRARSLKATTKPPASNAAVPAVTDVEVFDIEAFFADEAPLEESSK
jgi:predicted DNA-binding protein